MCTPNIDVHSYISVQSYIGICNPGVISITIIVLDKCHFGTHPTLPRGTHYEKCMENYRLTTSHVVHSIPSTLYSVSMLNGLRQQVPPDGGK